MTTEAERYAAALKAVIDYAGEMVQQQRTMAPEEVLDLIGHEIQLELCFRPRVLGVSTSPGPMPGPEFYAGRKVPIPEDLREVFGVDPAGGDAVVGASFDSEGRIHTRIVDWRDPTPQSDARQLEALEKLEAALPPGFSGAARPKDRFTIAEAERITRGDD